jgi:hypothetical protein
MNPYTRRGKRKKRNRRLIVIAQNSGLGGRVAPPHEARRYLEGRPVYWAY